MTGAVPHPPAAPRASISDLLEDAIESIAEGFMLFDAEDRLIAVNRRYREFYGLSDDEFHPGETWIDLLHQNVARGRYPEAMGREEAFVAERVRLRRQTGAYELHLSTGRWLRCSDRATREGGMVSIRADVTEEKRRESRLTAMEREARENEERLREIVFANPLPMTITRARDGLVVYANQRAADMVRTPLDALIGQRSVDFYAYEKDRETVLRQLKENGRVELLEVMFKRGDGTTFPLALVCRPITYQGEPAIVAGFHELSEWRRMEEALHQNEKLAALGSLLAGVAHELNNPLAVVLAQAALLQETATDPKVLARADRIHAAAERCARTVRSFLTIARQRTPEYRRVDLAEVVDQALELTAYGLKSNGVEVAVDCPEDLPPVWGDPDQLGQVFLNLVVNAQQAVQARQDGRRLGVQARHDAARGRIVVRVSDNGPGVPAAIRGRIFDAFFTTKPLGSGTGVGLSVCLGIVGAHGGALSLDDAAPEGATFVVELPTAEAAGEAAPEPDALAPPEPARWSILVVDDEPEIGRSMAEILGPLAHRIDVAQDGIEALELSARNPYDLVVSDLRMPGLDGPGLHRRLAERGGPLSERMLFITGDTLHHDLEGFLASIRAPVLEKPLSPAEVRRRVLEFMGEVAGRG